MDANAHLAGDRRAQLEVKRMNAIELRKHVGQQSQALAGVVGVAQNSGKDAGLAVIGRPPMARRR